MTLSPAQSACLAVLHRCGKSHAVKLARRATLARLRRAGLVDQDLNVTARGRDVVQNRETGWMIGGGK